MYFDKINWQGYGNPWLLDIEGIITVFVTFFLHREQLHIFWQTGQDQVEASILSLTTP